MSDESFLFIAQKTIPIIAHKITKLRDASTKPKQFRELIGEIATLLSYEATRTLETEKKLVSTPMGETTGERIKTTVGLVPILRAGLGMLEGALNLLPFAKVFHIGLYRDEETLQPVHYYNKMKLETISNTDLCIILDPMLATGGSINATIDSLREKGAKKIIVMIAILPLFFFFSVINIYLGDRNFGST